MNQSHLVVDQLVAVATPLYEQWSQSAAGRRGDPPPDFGVHPDVWDSLQRAGPVVVKVFGMRIVPVINGARVLA